MFVRRSALFLVTLWFFAMGAANASCPVTITAAQAVASGSAHGYAEYQIDLQAPRRDRYAATLRLKLAGGAPDVSLAASALPLGDDSMLVFYRPTLDVAAVSIEALTALPGVVRTDCSDARPFVLDTSEAAAVVAYDGGGSADPPTDPPDLTQAFPVASAVLQVGVKPIYPFMAVGFERQGSVNVMVTLDPGGKVMDARVTATSGNKWLDAAALTAARKSVYRPARALSPGVSLPLITSYELQYDFALR